VSLERRVMAFADAPVLLTRPLTIVGLAVAALLLVPTAAEGTDCDAGSVIRGGGGEAGVECTDDEDDGGAAAQQVRVGGDAPACTAERAADPSLWWISLDVPEWVLTWSKDTRQEYLLANPPEGMTIGVYRDCNGEVRSAPFLMPEPEPLPGVVAADETLATTIAREQARTRVEPRAPRVHVSPEQAVVRFPTWLWLDESYWQPRAATTATPSGVAVGVRARPVRAEWDLGDGVKVCDGPGIAWSQAAQDTYDAQPDTSRGNGDPACTFTFVNASSTRPSGVFDASVSVVWEFSWSLDGVERGVFGSVRVVERWPLTVGEVQTVITG
jgi:hypothetical protein